MLDVVLLAGSANSGPMRECSNETNEAMIKIDTKPMISYVADALIGSRFIDKIVIVGPKELNEVFTEKSITIMEPGNTAVSNLVKGLKLVDAGRKVLVSTCDIPLLTTKAVDELISMCTDKDVDLFYPIVPMETVFKKFPDIKRTSVNLSDGNFTGGNLFIINPGAVDSCVPKIEQFVSFRKSPIKLCRLLGMKFVFKFLFNRLSISEIEKKVSELLGIKGRAVITFSPEIGVDVDKPSDYSIVSAYLKNPV